ncbi:esterase family protein [Nocardia brasiliensis]|uniref:Esterase family protein n=1 Tax=Nocardia brasiliensis TaxID=37326 RepID=A0A6G9XL35_NOCBR|nr:alpha/beta hydrolase family protein [Nocardia brasiliensis]QIS01625.1 esterase family protein [Nocardia brasiliensis]
MRGSYLRWLGVLAVTVGAFATAVISTPAQAEPAESSIVAVRQHDARRATLTIHSAAMERDIQVDMQRAFDTSVARPVLYLLQGAGGGEDGVTWATETDVMEFLSPKNVNVVSPIGGQFSYYADWVRDDERLGKQKWKTFLTRELPPIADKYFGSSGRNALAGFSMAGTTTLALAATTGDLYASVAAYSGCAQISDPVGQQFVQLTVEAWGWARMANMYGPPDDPRWAANDPYVQAEGLRGKSIYISSGGGIPGKYDELNGKYSLPGVDGFAAQLIKGGAIEAATNYCSRNMQARLNSLGIPATYDIHPDGTHSWGYWEEAFKNSWPTLAAPLGI